MKSPSALKPYPEMKDSGVGWIGDAPKRQRRSIRLQGYDYTRQGAYFVTICTRNRACLLGDIVEGRMHLSEAGRLAQAVWEDLPHHYPHVQIDVWVIMPNHMHGIIILTEAQATEDDMPVGADPKTDVGAISKINVGASKTDVGASKTDVGASKTDVGASKTDVGASKTDVGAISKTDVGAGLKPAPTVPVPAPTRHGLSEIVRAFKTFSARRINALHNTVGTPFWQRNYYEHVIRNQSALDQIRQYIADNPARWSEDLENPAVRDG